MAGLQARIHAFAAAADDGETTGSMPQFDPAVIESQLVWLAITFGLLYILMSRVALPKVSKVQQDRSQRIASDLDQAEKLRSQTDELENQLEARLANARAEANAATAAAQEDAAETANRHLSDLNAHLDAELEAAESRIADACADVRAEVEDMATGLCADIVDRLVSESPPDTAVRDAVKAARDSEERIS